MRRQICLRFEPKVWKKRGKVMSEIKVKFLPKVWSNGIRLKAASKVLSNMFEIQVKSLTKRCCQICLFFFSSHIALLARLALPVNSSSASRFARMPLYCLAWLIKRLIYRLEFKLRFQSNSIVQLHDDVMLLQLPESLSLLFSYAN